METEAVEPTTETAEPTTEAAEPTTEASEETAEASEETTEAEKTPLANVDPNAGYEQGKYSWSGDGEKSIKAASDVLGAKISDYAWGDGEKKASVYVTLDGLDELPDDAISLELAGPRDVKLTITFSTVQRTLELAGTYGEVEAVKYLRKPGKNQIVLKLTKKKATTWYNLLGAGGADYDYPDDEEDDVGDDDDDEEEPMEDDIPLDDDLEAGDEPKADEDEPEAATDEPAAGAAAPAEEEAPPAPNDGPADDFEETGVDEVQPSE